MKKRVLIIFIIIISLMLCACGGNNGCTDSSGADEQNTEITKPNDENEQQENQDGEGDNMKDAITEMKITVNGKDFIAKFSDNETSRVFAEMLPMTVSMSAMAHEKYYYLPSNLPTAAYNPQTIQSGDIMLWGSNCLVLFYESFSTSYSYTKIGKIENTAGLASAVGSGSVTITFSAN